MGGPSLAGKPVAHRARICARRSLWALGSLLARRTHDVGGDARRRCHDAGAADADAAARALVVAALAARRAHARAHASAQAWLALAYLFVFGSLIGFTAYAWLLRNARPVVATSYAYVNPVLAVLIGAALYGEPLGWTTASRTC